MCDEHFDHDLENYSRFHNMTGRQLAAMPMGAGMLRTLPRAADAAFELFKSALA